jgi:FkbM family methyltransferase
MGRWGKRGCPGVALCAVPPVVSPSVRGVAAVFPLKVFQDVIGSGRVCGWEIAARWAGGVFCDLPRTVRERNLQGADRRLERRPIPGRFGTGRLVWFEGLGSYSGIREIWVRNVYGIGETVDIWPGARVLDLGANQGTFSMLAASLGAKVVAVEPGIGLSSRIGAVAERNGLSGQLRVLSVAVGSTTKVQEAMASMEEYRGIRFIGEEELLEAVGWESIDLFKCDIEGSEFGLLRDGGGILGRARQVAMEIHPWGGSVEVFMKSLIGLGFKLRVSEADARGGVIVSGRKE